MTIRVWESKKPPASALFEGTAQAVRQPISSERRGVKSSCARGVGAPRQKVPKDEDKQGGRVDWRHEIGTIIFFLKKTVFERHTCLCGFWSLVFDMVSWWVWGGASFQWKKQGGINPWKNIYHKSTVCRVIFGRAPRYRIKGCSLY